MTSVNKGPQVVKINSLNWIPGLRAKLEGEENDTSERGTTVSNLRSHDLISKSKAKQRGPLTLSAIITMCVYAGPCKGRDGRATAEG